jgi:hypothetical protein
MDSEAASELRMAGKALQELVSYVLFFFFLASSLLFSNLRITLSALPTPQDGEIVCVGHGPARDTLPATVSLKSSVT